MGGTRTRRTPRKRHTHHPPGPRADRPADPAGTRDRCARRPGPHQKADRRTALPLPPHREHPPVPRLPQGRHQLTSSPTRHTRRAATRQRLNGMNIARVPGRDRVGAGPGEIRRRAGAPDRRRRASAPSRSALRPWLSAPSGLVRLGAREQRRQVAHRPGLGDGLVRQGTGEQTLGGPVVARPIASGC